MLFKITNLQRIKFTKITVCLAFLLTLPISYKVWLTDRNFPLAPLFDFLPTVQYPIDYLFIIVLVLLLGIVMIQDLPRVPIILLFCVYWIMAFLDQNRIQPYFYQFAFMLLCISTLRKTSSKEKRLVALNTLRIILVGSYLWAGIHKINPSFVNRFYPFIFGLGYELPAEEPFYTLIKYSALLIPLTEILVAIGLMLNRFRPHALYIVIMMHISIIIYFSPLGLGWNLIIIPWNFGLIFMNLFLFHKSNFSITELWQVQRSFLKAVVILLFVIMPFWNLFGLWDAYLSFSLYSFKTRYAAIYIDDTLKKELPKYLNEYIKKDYKGEYIETTYWMLGEINQAPYPEKRVYKKALEFVCQFSTKDPCTAKLVYY